MKLENVTAEIRPRGRWESIDLGCALVRENFTKVLTVWVVTVVPLWIAIISLCLLVFPASEGRAWFTALLCIWVVPICDRVILFVLSRKLFGEDVTWKGVLGIMLTVFKRRFFRSLLCGPLALSRGLSMPVIELEGLKGQAYKDRVALLSRNGGDGAAQVSMVGFVLITATVVSLLFIFAYVMVPLGDSIVVEEFWVNYIAGSDAVFIPAPYVWGLLVFTLIAITLIEPFCVGAGFAIYINSRTITEGWDIELAFKRMSERVKSLSTTPSKVILGIIAALFCFSNMGAEASNPRIDEVMQDEDFVVHSETVEVPNYSTSYSTGGGGTFLAAISNLIFWAVVGAVIVAIIWVIAKNTHVFGKPSLDLGDASQKMKLSTVMGMDVAPESLPADIVKAAREAWDAGDHHLSLSLLYRGAISRLVHEWAVPIHSADTEMDCVKRVDVTTQGEVSKYFEKLTQLWMGLAYGKMVPENTDALSLYNNWPFDKTKPSAERRDR